LFFRHAARLTVQHGYKMVAVTFLSHSPKNGVNLPFFLKVSHFDTVCFIWLNGSRYRVGMLFFFIPSSNKTKNDKGDNDCEHKND
jgi:hypothetical protein